MLRTLLNFGWNLPTWIGYLTFVALVYATYFFIRYLAKLHKIKFPKRTQKVVLETIHSAVVFGVVIIFLYFAFGKGQRPYIMPVEQDGMRQLTEQMPEELSLEEIQEDTGKRKSEFLKQIERRDAKEEQEDADDYIRKALKRAKAREEATNK